MNFTRDDIFALALETVQSPRTAAQKIIALQLSRDMLWTGLAFVAAINAIIYSFSLFTGDASVLPALLRNPVMFYVIISGLLIVSIHAFYWTGHAMGGEGDLGDLLALLVWLQALRAVGQAIMFVLIIVSPAIAQLFSLGVGLLGLWITVNFITEALRLPTLMRGVGVIIVAAMGMVVGLMLLIGLIGAGTLGVPTNV